MIPKIVRITLIIVVLILCGCFFLQYKKNAISKTVSKMNAYPPEVVSTFLGIGLLGMAASCIPSLLSLLLQKKWLNIISIVLLVSFLLSIFFVERRYRKRNKKDENQ